MGMSHFSLASEDERAKDATSKGHKTPPNSTNWKDVLVELMAWLALLGKLNTRERLVKKRIIPAELNKCTFCSNHSEDINHLLLSCQISWRVWKAIAEELGGQITCPNSIRSFYADWLNQRFANRTRRKLWIATFFATIWSLWMKRNGIIFNQEKLDLNDLLHIIKWRVANWSRAWEENLPYSVEMLAHNFHAVPILFQ
uniref:Reverse transcriptase zinc-binding domain-containing protein n=1 Tax=Opuntia streptacantha TaxID=393608 RepID=A0A7C8ZX61_OPUST